LIFRVGALPPKAVEHGFFPNPLPYESFGQYSAKAGAKLQDPEMSEFGALRELLSRQLIKLFRTRAEAYFAGKYMHEEYDKDGLWRYWTAVIGHGVVQYSTEDDAYVAEKSSIDGVVGQRLPAKAAHEGAVAASKAGMDCTERPIDGSFQPQAPRSCGFPHSAC